MSREKLRYLTLPALDRLKEEIPSNLERYRSTGFDDLLEEDGQAIELSLNVDLSPLDDLVPDKGVKAEVENSLLVWRALHGLTPSLAREERIWARITHLQGLKYSRVRWLRTDSDENLVDDITTHMFAETLTKCRDDNAISRLWWNACIAKQLMPDNQKKALELMLKKADIRSNLVERSWIFTRTGVASGIVRAMIKEKSITDTENGFREFMKNVNRKGGGILFEVMDSQQIDEFLKECLQGN